MEKVIISIESRELRKEAFGNSWKVKSVYEISEVL